MEPLRVPRTDPGYVALRRVEAGDRLYHFLNGFSAGGQHPSSLIRHWRREPLATHDVGRMARPSPSKVMFWGRDDGSHVATAHYPDPPNPRAEPQHELGLPVSEGRIIAFRQGSGGTGNAPYRVSGVAIHGTHADTQRQYVQWVQSEGGQSGEAAFRHGQTAFDLRHDTLDNRTLDGIKFALRVGGRNPYGVTVAQEHAQYRDMYGADVLEGSEPEEEPDYRWPTTHGVH